MNKWVAVLIAAVLMILLLIGATEVAKYATWVDYKKPVESPPPGSFPVLVVVKQTDRLVPHVIYYNELEAVKSRFTDWSFQLPPDEVARMKKEIKGQPIKTITGRDLVFPSFSVDQADGNRQRFEVYGTVDDDVVNRSWYFAEGQEIVPEFYEQYDRGDQKVSCLAFVIVVAVWLVVTPFVLKSVYRRFVAA